MNKISRSFIEQINNVSLIEFMEKEYDSDFSFNNSSKWANTNCPMPNHDDTSPSFGVNSESNLFHCFGCGVKGDIIKLVQSVEGLNFIESIQRIANYAGVEIEIADLDFKNIIKELTKNIDTYLKDEKENKFPGGLSELSFMLAFAERTKKFIRNTNYDEEQIKWTEDIYKNIEKFIDDQNYKEIENIWLKFSKDSKSRLQKYNEQFKTQ